MAMLSELLDFRHHDCARGSKVEKPFLVDLAWSLGVSVSDDMTKDDLILKSYLAATGKHGAKDLLSVSGTVTNYALQSIAEGVIANNLNKNDLHRGAPAARIAVARLEAALDEGIQIDDPFDPLDLADERKATLRRVVTRTGQGKFRALVLAAYDGRCAITGYSEPAALEAAHITPYRGSRTDVVTNGLALRADLHRLWDTGLLAVHEDSHEVLIAKQLRDSHYGELLGGVTRLPENVTARPSKAALQAQREWCSL